MAQVSLPIGDRTHLIACADGDEPRLLRLGTMLDERWASARRAAGNNTERAMLLIALMLADALDEAESAPPPPPTGSDAVLLEVAERLEAIATALEQDASTA